MGVSRPRAALAALRTTTGRRVVGVVAALAVTTTGVAAVAATETKTQPRPRIVVPPVAVQQAGGVTTLPALPALPPLELPDPNSSIPPESLTPPLPDGPQTWGLSSVASGIPAQAHAAYQAAQRLLSSADPGCRIDWALLAGIGKVESDHGRWGRNLLDSAGTAVPGIFGIPLTGAGVARITDTDGGRFDRDTTYDRAVGPMQFIPGTWKSVGADGNGDGRRDPQNMSDAATAAGIYLCSGPGDLTQPGDLTRAVLRYNHSMDYVAKVTSIAASYRSGHSVLPATALPPGFGDRAPYLPPAGAAPRSGGASATPSPSTAPSAKPKPKPRPAPSSKPTAPAQQPAPRPAPTTAPAPRPTTVPKPKPVPAPPPPTLPKVTATPVPSTTVKVDPDPFSPGDTVKITAGAHVGVTTKILKVDTVKNTVTVAVTVLGAEVPVTLPYSSIAPVK
ncbi:MULTISPECIES: lytic murein transglycosylase [unclassified Knoellia]|uniref:lytic murein transglycosylase n=1 Tax=Knoellia altitudinis TaxID=3404795 RepID=UPI003606CED4